MILGIKHTVDCKLINNYVYTQFNKNLKHENWPRFIMTTK